jgi:hypothetical protein
MYLLSISERIDRSAMNTPVQRRSYRSATAKAQIAQDTFAPRMIAAQRFDCAQSRIFPEQYRCRMWCLLGFVVFMAETQHTYNYIPRLDTHPMDCSNYRGSFYIKGKQGGIRRVRGTRQLRSLASLPA